MEIKECYRYTSRLALWYLASEETEKWEKLQKGKFNN
jgi:hypothetical protein